MGFLFFILVLSYGMNGFCLRVAIHGIPHPQVNQPFLSLGHRQGGMLREIIKIAIRQLGIKQNGPTYLWRYLECAKCFRIDPTRKGGFATGHALIEIQ